MTNSNDRMMMDRDFGPERLTEAQADRGEKVLKWANQTLDERGWCNGYLVHPATGSHCALGAIGYAKWGNEFDQKVLKGEQNGYEMISDDPDTATAMQQLANQIRATRGVPHITLDPMDQVRNNWAVATVMNYNDAQQESFNIRGVFKQAKGWFADRRAKRLAVKKPRVEHITRDHVESMEKVKEEA
jgi:hypothetical protein